MHKVWDGTEWSSAKALKVWNGTQWKAGLKFKVRTSSSWLPGSVSDKDDSQIVKWSVEGPTPPPPPPPITHPVPDLDLKTLQEVEALLDPLNFTYSVIDYENTSISNRDDKVVIDSQIPAAGQSLAEGSNVVFKLYNFVQPTTTVPNLDNLLISAANTAITNANLVVSTNIGTDETYDTNKIGRVIVGSQYPTAGSTVDTGTEVTYDKWIQKAFATVPNIVGLNDSQVFSTLDAANLNIGTRTVVATSVAANDDKVKSQFPAQGTQVQQDSNVNYEVWDYSLRVVPNLNGLTQAQASTALDNAGLYTGNITNQETTVVADEGKVKANSQSHPAGSEVNAGTSINFVVWVPNTTTTVPNVVGLQGLTNISNVLNAAELNSSIRTMTNTRDSNLFLKVYGQSPSQGTVVPVFSTVQLDMYFQEPQYTVPSIIQLTPSSGPIDAYFTWGSNSLAGTGTENVNNFGKVATQSPGAGTTQYAGAVNYGVYTDSRPIVPNVVGMTEANAKTAINNAGLNWSVTRKAQTSNGQATAGTVNSQSPTGGTRLASGGTVTIEVWDAYVPQQVTRTAYVRIGSNNVSGWTTNGVTTTWTQGDLDWKSQVLYKNSNTSGSTKWATGTWPNTLTVISTGDSITQRAGYQGTTNGRWTAFYDFDKNLVTSRLKSSLTNNNDFTVTSAQFKMLDGGNYSKTWYLDYFGTIPSSLNEDSVFNTQNIGSNLTFPTLNSTMKTQIWDYDGAICVHNKNSSSSTNYDTISYAYLELYITWTELQ